METTSTWQTGTVLLGGLCTLAIFSFLIKENAFYRFFEHLFIGIAAGFLPIFTIKDFLWPRVLAPMLGLTAVTFPDGTIAAPYQPLYLIFILPMLFGLLYYFIYSKRYSWIAKIVIGFTLGSSAGLAFKGFFAEMIPQLTKSFRPLVVLLGEGGIDWGTSLKNSIFVFTLLSVMYYFFFSFRREGRASRSVATSGRWLMMICFGAFFGSTVMARMALLVERMQFLLVDWLSALGRLF